MIKVSRELKRNKTAGRERASERRPEDWSCWRDLGVKVRAESRKERQIRLG